MILVFTITPAICVQHKTAPVLTESMEVHLSVPRALEVLAADINAHPERILPVEMRLVDRVRSLVGQIDVDLNSPPSAQDE